MQDLFGIGTPLAALPGMVAEVASLVIIWHATRRGGAGRGPALFATIATAGLLLRMYPSVGFRTDPFLLLLSSLGLLATTWAPSMGQAMALGLCAGLATALKPSGGLYLGPALLAALPARAPVAAGRYILLTSIACLAGALLPFAGTDTSPTGYLAYLAALKPKGMHGKELMENSLMALLMSAPALLIPPAERRARGAMTAGLCLCLPVACVLGALDGAGVWHLLPFIPYTALLVGIAATAQAGWSPRTLGQAMVVLLIMADGARHAAREASESAAWAPQAERLHQAVVDFLSHHPDAAVAIAPRAGQLNREVAWLVGQGKPLILTRGSWIDLGKPEAIQLFIDRYLSRCDGLSWLGMGNPPFFPGRETPPAVSAAFMALYHRQSWGEGLEVWSCVPTPDEPPT
ncbi:glycosyltransferase family 39 protein [Azospirillum sp. B4]|uniref:glycosyltransferase family 39 protein n=1 Tax=Azospirillum sp. B4 TaxID=95605 RepID=UPI000348DB18|nr:glycosyltransferase family 39 protein [Azospirillum sp. B4]